jgi:hypothetical protein
LDREIALLGRWGNFFVLFFSVEIDMAIIIFLGPVRMKIIAGIFNAGRVQRHK